MQILKKLYLIKALPLRFVRRWRRLPILMGTGFLLVMLAGCNGLFIGSMEGGDSDRSFAKLLGDMPLPKGARIVGERTLILGGASDWTGRLFIDCEQGWADTFAFFRDQYPAVGWTLISSMQARNSILVMAKGERTATIEISPAGLMGARASASITVAPKVAGASKAKGSTLLK